MVIMHTFRLSASLHSGDIKVKFGPDQNKYSYILRNIENYNFMYFTPDSH